MTFTLRKIGVQQADLTMTMILLCLFVDTRKSLCSYMFRIVNFYFFWLGNISHPYLVYFQCDLGVETGREFPVRVYV